MAKEKEKIIKMVEIEVELDKETVEKLKKIALKEIANDTPALINYIVGKILKEKMDKEIKVKVKTKK